MYIHPNSHFKVSPTQIKYLKQTKTVSFNCYLVSLFNKSNTWSDHTYTSIYKTVCVIHENRRM